MQMFIQGQQKLVTNWLNKPQCYSRL